MDITVSTTQYELKPIDTFADFSRQVEEMVEVAAERKSDFLLFPELFTTQLLTTDEALSREYGVEHLDLFTNQYTALFRNLATKTRMHIIAGTHIVKRSDRFFNTSFMFYPEGRVVEQAKLHLTTCEKAPWKFTPGAQLEVFDTEYGVVGVLICYDIEFPELSRIVRQKGADMVFCPSCTYDQHGFHRVNYCAHARAVENDLCVVTANTVGGLAGVESMERSEGRAEVIGPNQLPFPANGVLAAGEMNRPMVVTGTLDIEQLTQIRQGGDVSPWADRRVGFYERL